MPQITLGPLKYPTIRIARPEFDFKYVLNSVLVVVLVIGGIFYRRHHWVQGRPWSRFYGSYRRRVGPGACNCKPEAGRLSLSPIQYHFKFGAGPRWLDIYLAVQSRCHSDENHRQGRSAEYSLRFNCECLLIATPASLCKGLPRSPVHHGHSDGWHWGRYKISTLFCTIFFSARITHIFRGYKWTYSGMAQNRRASMFGLGRCPCLFGRECTTALQHEVTTTRGTRPCQEHGSVHGQPYQFKF